jgi:hypothetical protein
MIDYKILDDSVKYYEDCDFKRIETPWTVTKEIAEITKPDWVPADSQFELKHKDGKMLVASGEQSFLYLYNKEFLPKGRFQTITPCFREDHFDETHTKYFMKNELIITDKPDITSLYEIVGRAMTFFSSYVEYNDNLCYQWTSETDCDINLNGIEIGSYGLRKCGFLEWVYGTGVAEPRFSRILRKN